MTVTIISHEDHGVDEESGLRNRHYRFVGTADGIPFAVWWCGREVDYEQPSAALDDLITENDTDEPIQTAIGEYCEKHDIDVWA